MTKEEGIILTSKECDLINQALRALEDCARDAATAEGNWREVTDAQNKAGAPYRMLHSYIQSEACQNRHGNENHIELDLPLAAIETFFEAVGYLKSTADRITNAYAA